VLTASHIQRFVSRGEDDLPEKFLSACASSLAARGKESVTKIRFPATAGMDLKNGNASAVTPQQGRLADGDFRRDGDLPNGKLIPALINLAQENLLSREFASSASRFDSMTTESFRNQLSKDVAQFALVP